MIVRSPRKETYTNINNVPLNDNGLSFRATGLLAYILSKPDGWKVNDRHLAAAKTDGRTAVQSALKELEKAGYLVRTKRRCEKTGQWEWDSVLYETPQENPICYFTVDGLPVAGQPVAGQPVAGQPNHIVNTEVVNTDLASTEETTISFAGAKGAKTPSEQQQWFQKICDIVGWDYKVLTKDQQGQIAQTIGILRKADYTLQDLCDFGQKVWAKDWRWIQHKQRPTITQLRAEIGKLRAVDISKVSKPKPEEADEENWKSEGFESKEAYDEFYKYLEESKLIRG